MLIDYKKVNIYQDDVCVLHKVDFHVDEGEFIYIMRVNSSTSLERLEVENRHY